jgi:hypothetical protein
MMVRVTEENPGNELSRRDGTETDRPQSGAPTPEQLREFEEFRRFQEFQRWQREGSPAPSTGPSGQSSEAASSGASGEHEPAGVQTELAGMRRQLASLAESSSRVERATNPPLWRRILRSGWLRWLAGLIIVVVAAAIAYNKFFGGGDTSGNPQANLPGNRSQVQQRVGVQNPKDAVALVYRDVGMAASTPDSADVYAKNACLTFTEQAARKFGAQHGGTCEKAIRSIKVGDPGSYSDVSLAALPRVAGNARSTVIDSCKFDVSGGPRLGAFTLAVADGDKWLITDVAPSTCN